MEIFSRFIDFFNFNIHYFPNLAFKEKNLSRLNQIFLNIIVLSIVFIKFFYQM